jgi:hypothetical protein
LDRCSAAAPLAKHIPETEHVEDIVEITKASFESKPAGPCSDALMSETVVRSTFLCVREHRIGFGCFLELLFGVRIVRILVRVMLQGKRTVRLFYLNVGRRARYPKYFVIVSFSHAEMIVVRPPSLVFGSKTPKPVIQTKMNRQPRTNKRQSKR